MSKYTIQPYQHPILGNTTNYTIYADGRPVKTGFSSMDIARRYLKHMKEVEKHVKETGRTEGQA